MLHLAINNNNNNFICFKRLKPYAKCLAINNLLNEGVFIFIIINALYFTTFNKVTNDEN